MLPELDPNLLWTHPEPHAPLVLLFPGSTGSRLPTMRGFHVTAGHLWQEGFSSYLVVTAGQDQRPGSFSFQRSHWEARQVLEAVVDKLQPCALALVASCGGGTIAAHLAAEYPAIKALAIWETLPRYPPESREDFMATAPSRGLALAPSFADEYLETSDAAPRVTCPVLLMYGDGSSPPVCSESELRDLAGCFEKAASVQVRKIPGADHHLTRGSSPTHLARYHALLTPFLHTHLSSRPSLDVVLPAYAL